MSLCPEPKEKSVLSQMWQGLVGVREGLLRHSAEGIGQQGGRDWAAVTKEMICKARGPGSPLGQG